jgi:hypothetical protein
LGWLTEARSVMVTDSEPCDTAAGITRTCAADDHGPGARVDDDARRRLARLDLDLLERR